MRQSGIQNWILETIHSIITDLVDQYPDVYLDLYLYIVLQFLMSCFEHGSLSFIPNHYVMFSCLYYILWQSILYYGSIVHHSLCLYYIMAAYTILWQHFIWSLLIMSCFLLLSIQLLWGVWKVGTPYNRISKTIILISISIKLYPSQLF